MTRSFDLLARPYAQLERALFGHALEQARFAHLDQLREARTILLVGEGDGRVVQRLLTLAPHCHIDVVDRSPAMITRARERIAGTRRVTFHTADIRAFEPERRFDALATLFFLDCFEPPELFEIVSHLASMLEPAGKWLYSDFLPASTGVRQRAWLSFLYTAFGLLTDIEARTLVAPDEALTRAGLVRVRHRQHARRLLTSEVWRTPAPEPL
jgi:ubiquinone/menaquinone biosynthesis C-methylase UbiE